MEATVNPNIKVLWKNLSSEDIQLSWGGHETPIMLSSGEETIVLAAQVNDLNILSIHALLPDGSLSQPDLLFVGEVQAAAAVLQQAARNQVWVNVPYNRDMNNDHYAIELNISRDGLVIVGTVELVEPVLA